MDIMREITSLWQTDELRRHKPTPVDGGYYGLAWLLILTCDSHMISSVGRRVG